MYNIYSLVHQPENDVRLRGLANTVNRVTIRMDVIDRIFPSQQFVLGYVIFDFVNFTNVFDLAIKFHQRLHCKLKYASFMLR